MPTGNVARLLQHPGQAATGVDDARRDDRPGRAAVEAAPARAAAVGHRRGGRRVAAVVTTAPSTNQLPAPATSRLAFLPNQPSPAR